MAIIKFFAKEELKLFRRRKSLYSCDIVKRQGFFSTDDKTRRSKTNFTTK